MELSVTPFPRKPVFHLTIMTRTLLLLLALISPLSAAEDIRLAAQGRLLLLVPQDAPPLGGIRVSAGHAIPAQWEKDQATRERMTEVMFPIRWWRWEEISLHFTPAHDGTVDLQLNGPWSQKQGMPVSRQEVLWDGIDAEGAVIHNGGFEEVTGNDPVGWNSPAAPAASRDAWPLANVKALQGTGMAATWSQRPLVQKIEVKAGREVRLRLHARASTLPGFVEPKRLGPDTPAHRAMARIRRGVSLGNCWDADPKRRPVQYTLEDIDHVANEGFDHIRMPVAWHFHLRPKNGGFEIDPAFLAELEPFMKRALERKLHIMLDWHHFRDLTEDPAAHKNRFIAGWELIARHFQSWPPELFFEPLNEPCHALTTELANPIYQEVIATIRKTNPERILLISPGHWGNVNELDQLRLPDDDERLVGTFHSYEPFYFTHQGASWSGLSELKGVLYPGPPETPLELHESLRDHQGVSPFIANYNTQPAESNPSSPRGIKAALDTARAWSDHFGRPAHLGEFGTHESADLASRERFLRDMRTFAEERGIPWTLWQWRSAMGYWDADNKRPKFRDSLFE